MSPMLIPVGGGQSGCEFNVMHPFYPHLQSVIYRVLFLLKLWRFMKPFILGHVALRSCPVDHFRVPATYHLLQSLHFIDLYNSWYNSPKTRGEKSRECLLGEGNIRILESMG